MLRGGFITAHLQRPTSKRSAFTANGRGPQRKIRRRGARITSTIERELQFKADSRGRGVSASAQREAA